MIFQANLISNKQLPFLILPHSMRHFPFQTNFLKFIELYHNIEKIFRIFQESNKYLLTYLKFSNKQSCFNFLITSSLVKLVEKS